MDLRAALARYDEAKRAKTASAPDLAAVREFQADRLIARHGRQPVIVFFAEHIVRGIDLGGLEQEPDAAARLQRLLGSTEAVAAAVEFGALAQTLDAAIAQEIGGGTLSPRVYVRAYRRVNGTAQRHRQLALTAFVADNLARSARSRLTYMAFKMARRPARAAGFGALYELLAGGFDALREQPDTDRRINDALSTERRLVARLLE